MFTKTSITFFSALILCSVFFIEYSESQTQTFRKSKRWLENEREKELPERFSEDKKETKNIQFLKPEDILETEKDEELDSSLISIDSTGLIHLPRFSEDEESVGLNDYIKTNPDDVTIILNFPDSNISPKYIEDTYSIGLDEYDDDETDESTIVIDLTELFFPPENIEDEYSVGVDEYRDLTVDYVYGVSEE